jgi:hypothetical protein
MWLYVFIISGATCPTCAWITQSGSPFSASVVIAVCRPSWNRTEGSPAAFRTDRHADRQEVMCFEGSSRLLRPCHGNTKCVGCVNPSLVARSCSSFSTRRQVAFSVGDRQPAGVFDRRT